VLLNYFWIWKRNMKHHTEMIKSVWSFPFTLLQAPGLAGNEIQVWGGTQESSQLSKVTYVNYAKAKWNVSFCMTVLIVSGTWGSHSKTQPSKSLQRRNRQIRNPAFRNLVDLDSHSEGSVFWQPIRFVCGYFCQHSPSFTSIKIKLWRCEEN
jgi:hypothetical protein